MTDISEVAARLREAATRWVGGVRMDVATADVIALLDDWERRGKERDDLRAKYNDSAQETVAVDTELDDARDELVAAEARTQDAFESLRQCQEEHRVRVAELEKERDRQGALLLEWSNEGRKHIARLREIDALTARAALDPVLSMDERALIGLVMRLTGGGANPRTVSAQIARIRGEAKGA